MDVQGLIVLFANTIIAIVVTFIINFRSQKDDHDPTVVRLKILLTFLYSFTFLVFITFVIFDW